MTQINPSPATSRKPLLWGGPVGTLVPLTARSDRLNAQVPLYPQREGNGNPLQYSCLENPMDRGAWWGYSPWGGKESGMTEQLSTLPPECAQRILAGIWNLTQDLCASRVPWTLICPCVAQAAG